MNTGVKRSLFTKPAWAAPAASSSKIEDDGSVFGRNVAYDDIVQAEQAKRERKAAKAKLHADKGKSVSPSTKRRRISVEKDNEAASGSGSDTGVASRRRASDKSRRGRDRPVTRSTPWKDMTLETGSLSRSPTRSSRSPRTGHHATSAVASIAVDEDEDDALVMLTPSKPKKTAPTRPTASLPVDDDESDEEDEYLRDLKQKAREKIRLQRLGLDLDRAQSPLTSTSSAPTIPRGLSTEQSQSRPVSASSGQDFGRATPASEQEDDPQVKILIQSDIPNTNPLIVRRKASQSLRQVREYWCKRWQLDDSVSRKVFFTWRGTRLFDSTTMRGIIKKLKKDHRQQSTGLDEGDDSEDDGDEEEEDDPSSGNILLEAVTPEIYEEKLRQKEQRQNRASADEDPDSSEEAAVSSRAQTDDRDTAGSIVIRLVSKAHEPLQLRVRPHTTVGKIMRGYAATKKLDDGKTPWLVFDGDRLEPEATVQDVGLEDEDEVEVNIR